MRDSRSGAARTLKASYRLEHDAGNDEAGSSRKHQVLLPDAVHALERFTLPGAAHP